MLASTIVTFTLGFLIAQWTTWWQTIILVVLYIVSHFLHEVQDGN